MPIDGYHEHTTLEDLELVRRAMIRKGFEVPEIERKKFSDPRRAREVLFRDLIMLASSAVKPKVIVELGTGGGWFTDIFLSVVDQTGGTVYSVDISPHIPYVRNTLDRLRGRRGFLFISGDSVEVGKNWDKGNIDILLCDSAHSYTHVLNELNEWGRFYPKIIFIHDTLDIDDKAGEPYRACHEYAQRYNRQFFNVNIRHGFGVIL